MNNKKLSAEELQELKVIQDKILQLTAQLGQLNIEKISLDLALEENLSNFERLKQQFKSLRTEESELQSKISTKYGLGTVNLETGEFISEV